MGTGEGGHRWQRAGNRRTGPGCSPRNAGCLPGSDRARRVPGQPQGSSWSSAPRSTPTPPRPPARDGELRPWPRPQPSQQACPLTHQLLQLPESQGEDVDLDDAAEDTQPLLSLLRWEAVRAEAHLWGSPTCGRGRRRYCSRPAGPRTQHLPAPPVPPGAVVRAAKEKGGCTLRLV